MKRLVVFLFLTLLLGPVRAEVNLKLESATVSSGQPFTLTLTIENPQGGGLPDLTPLNQDFTIVGTERSMNYTVFNGEAHSTSQWTITLLPKRNGKLTIPAIKVGQEKTDETSVDVTEATQNSSPSMDQREDVMLITEVSNKKPYVNEQVIYTVKLYNNRSFLDAQYQPPSVKDALLIPLGEGRHYQTLLNGINYAVEEQQYALFPQKSGKLTINPPAFNALLAAQIPQKITVSAKESSLQVKTIPSQWTGKDWLPAKQVKLTETYEPTSTSFKQGDMLIRTVMLQATGLAAQIMPSLDFGKSDYYNIYPEKPVERTTFQQDDLIGTTTFKVTYLLNKSGKIVIPALKLPWFNTTTGQMAMATLPEKIINVDVSAATSTETQPTTLVDTPVPSPAATAPVSSGTILQPGKKTGAYALAWWVAGFFAMAWLITLLLWLRSSKPQKSLAQAQNTLRKACLDHDANAAKEALLAWASLTWPQAKAANLADVIALVHDAEFKNQLHRLIQALYQSEPVNWRGDQLWLCVLRYKASSFRTKKKPDPLPPIHPFIR